MNKKATLKKFAKKLADLSLEGGVVSNERIEAVLATLRKNPPRKPKAVLKFYLHYIKQAINRSRAVIEYAGRIDDSGIGTIEAHLSQQYQRPISTTTIENESLIAGFRISIGDDIFDASVAGRLDNLAKSVH